MEKEIFVQVLVKSAKRDTSHHSYPYGNLTFDFGNTESHGLELMFTVAEIVCHGVYFPDSRAYVVDLLNFWS